MNGWEQLRFRAEVLLRSGLGDCLMLNMNLTTYEICWRLHEINLVMLRCLQRNVVYN